MMFNAEFESGMPKCWNLLKMMKYENCRKIKKFEFFVNRSLWSPGLIFTNPRAPGGARTLGAPWGVKISPGNPGDHVKISNFQKKIIRIILTRFQHFWMPDSNSALKICQGYGFKPRLGYFYIYFGFLSPLGPCDYEF